MDIRGAAAIVAGWLVFLGAAPAHASPLRLDVFVNAPYIYQYSSFDVSDGFAPTSITGRSGRILTDMPMGESRPFEQPLWAGATLVDDQGEIAVIGFQGMAEGFLRREWDDNDRHSGGFDGPMTRNYFSVSRPGLDPASLPAWFTGMTVEAFGSVTGGYRSYWLTRVDFVPGSATPTPEPGTALVFLAAIGGIAATRRRRLARSDAPRR